MSYKTILVHIDPSAQCATRVKAAAQIAVANDAHLIGTALTNLSPLYFSSSGLDPAVPALALPLEQLRKDAARTLDEFDQQARRLGVNSLERCLLEEEAGLGISLQARYCDLVVLSLHDHKAPIPGLRADFPEYVLLNCARPVLMMPSVLPKAALGSKIVVAWDGSVPSTRAIASALPMLEHARSVELVVLNAGMEELPQGSLPATGMAAYLARHGVRVEVRAVEHVGDIGEKLLQLAADGGADLIVMGAYGHSRFREILLGGTTRKLLRSSTVPLWMMH